MNRSVLRIIGIASWIALTGLLLSALSHKQNWNATEADASLKDYLLGQTEHVPVTMANGQLRNHDPVFLRNADGSWKQAGFVQIAAAGSAAGTTADTSAPNAVLNWQVTDVDPYECQYFLYRNRGRLEDVITTMLPPETQMKIRQRLSSTMKQHSNELSAAFVPLVQESMKQSLPLIESEFRRSVQRHRGEIEALGNRWNDEVVSQRLVPLARREIVPIVRKHGQPTAEDIGRELWDRASLWSFGWRAAYDGLPLVPRKDLVREEWVRFVEDEAVPVFEERMDEIVASIQKIIADVAANPEVRKELSNVAVVIANDPEAQQLVREVLRESIVDNQKLKDAWKAIWSSEEAQQAFELAGDRLEPVIREIGDDLIGSREQGINPNFARILRNQILGKDRQWIVAIPNESENRKQVIRVEVSKTTMPYPIVYLANPDNTQLRIDDSNRSYKPTPESHSDLTEATAE